MKELLFYPYYTMLKSKPEFKIGITLFTKGVWELIENDCIFINEIDACFERYVHKDLGFLGEESDDEYVYKVIDGEEIMGGYETTKGNIYIVTSHDRNGTIILLPEER